MVCEDMDFKQYTVPHWKPVQVSKDGGDVIVFLGVGDETGSGVLNTLKFLDVTVR